MFGGASPTGINHEAENRRRQCPGKPGRRLKGNAFDLKGQSLSTRQAQEQVRTSRRRPTQLPWELSTQGPTAELHRGELSAGFSTVQALSNGFPSLGT